MLHLAAVAKKLSSLPPLPLSLTSDNVWLLKIIGIEDRFVLGSKAGQMKAISYLSKIENLIGVLATTRNLEHDQKGVMVLDNA